MTQDGMPNYILFPRLDLPREIKANPLQAGDFVSRECRTSVVFVSEVISVSSFCGVGMHYVGLHSNTFGS